LSSLDPYLKYLSLEYTYGVRVNFESFNLPELILANLQASGYQSPTPIQAKSLPLILEGSDLIGIAQTGTGKTAAFILPILKRLLEHPYRKATDSKRLVRALIIVPTRELAQQIDVGFGKLGKNSGVRAVLLYGGISTSTQAKALRDGVDIIIACPGRLRDHIRQGNINLTTVEMLVLDEADQMFDRGFLDEIKEILAELSHPHRQSILFSATMGKEAFTLAKQILKTPKTVQVDPIAPANNIKQILYPVPEKLKTELLFSLLGTTQTQSVLIFTRTKYRAEQLAEQLHKKGFTASSLQSNLNQSKRKTILRRFREGAIKVLVATDILGRGIDIPNISHMINFDMPNNLDAYIHRIGRTGRAGQAGTAFTFVTPSDKGSVNVIERERKKQGQSEILFEYVSDFNYKNKAPEVLIQNEDNFSRSRPLRRPSRDSNPFPARKTDVSQRRPRRYPKKKQYQ
jgi:ATP-dependent RNA helicase RhlE